MDRLIIEAIFVGIAEIAFIIFMVFMIVQKSKEK
jgi:hypothetical protein